MEDGGTKHLLQKGLFKKYMAIIRANHFLNEPGMAGLLLKALAAKRAI